MVVDVEFNHAHLIVTTAYRSPNSTTENNDALNNLITEVCSQRKGNNLILGDFNYHIDWSSDGTKINDISSQKFFFQHNTCRALPDAGVPMNLAFWTLF